MKVIISSYLIFLNLYIIESAGLSSSTNFNENNITQTLATLIPTATIATTTTTTETITEIVTTTTTGNNNISSSSNSLIKPVTETTKIFQLEQQHDQQQEEQQLQEQYLQKRSTVVAVIPIPTRQSNNGNNNTTNEPKLRTTTTTTTATVTARYQHVELPTYRQQQPVQQQTSPSSSASSSTSSSSSTKLKRVTLPLPIIYNAERIPSVVGNYENEINDDNQLYNIADVDSDNNDDNDNNNRNEKLKYGMKTNSVTKTPPKTKQNLTNLENSKINLNDFKRNLTLKPRKDKPEKPTKSQFLTVADDKRTLPKKYIPTTSSKPRTTTSIKKSTTSNISSGPTKIQLYQKSSTLDLNSSLDNLVCPKETEAHFNLFAVNCKIDNDCTAWNKDFRCCTLFGSRNCHRGVSKPLKEPPHSPILGLIPRKCPERPLAEFFWDLKTCETDNDCWPRVCCPDGRNKYCRTSTPEYKSVPFQIGRPLAYVSEYLECTPPPPPIFDLHPKPCNSTLDCFPNVCCQEAGKKNCRPPKKSVLSFMANFFNTGLVRRLTNNLVIKR